MIIKNLTRKSGASQLVNYLFKYFLKEQKQGNISDKPLIVKRNLRTNKIQSWAKQFDANEKLRLRKRKNNILLHHTIVSFSSKDKKNITKSLLKDIAKKYIELRGGNNIYIATAHYDRDHIHLHIAMSGCKYKTGESNRLSHKQFRELKIELDRYQREKYPELIHSLPRHGRKNSKELDQTDKKALTLGIRTNQKQQVFDSLNNAFQKSNSVKEFLEQIKSDGLDAYYRGGKLYGVQNEFDRRFRFKTLGVEIEKLDEREEVEKRSSREMENLRSLRESKETEQERDNEERIIEDEDDSDERDQVETETLDSDDDKTAL
ncbi:MAG: relaxase/mobilization nuclease domain-containing protein [Bacteroidia bacterium]